MLEVGREDPNLVVLVGDISHFLLQPFAKACPGRYYNVGICEQTIVSMAAGLARVGFFPVVHTIAPFIVERSFEQLKLDFCYQKLGGNLVTIGSAFDYSNLGCSHHCYDDFSLLKSLPDTEIIYPASAVEFDQLFRQTYRDGKLTLFRVPSVQHGEDFALEEIRFGKGMKLTHGDNLTLIVTGPQLRTALDATEKLVSLGIETEVIYLHTLRPLDSDLVLASVRKTHRVLVVEEHMRSGGLGDEVLRLVNGIDGIQFSSLAIPDQFVTSYGSYEDHCRELGFTVGGILGRVKEDFDFKKIRSHADETVEAIGDA